MRALETTQHGALHPWFSPERPGPLVWPHVVQTGHGRCWVDRWPGPRTVLAETGSNYALRGDPELLVDPVKPIKGFVEAPPVFQDALRALDPGLHVWDRVVLELPVSPAGERPAGNVCRLGIANVPALAALTPSSRWICRTYGGPAGVAAAGMAWGAFADGRLVSVAIPFFLGRCYEDLGVVTDAGHRGRGLSTACASRVVADVLARGHRPTWTTSPDNAASLRVAERLGFRPTRADHLYVVRTPLPTS